MDQQRDITRLLHEASAGNEGAWDQAMALVYADLERLAAKHMRQQFGPGLAGVTLEPAALVHETFLKLIEQRGRYANRRQFFAIATRLMLRVLMDYHRARGAVKRGGEHLRVTLTGLVAAEAPASPVDVPQIVGALEKLEELAPRKAEVVKLKIFWELEMSEVATIIGVSLATVERDWSFARTWLHAELEDAR
jgi:RNA polymerase sigma factor (TIGR02999 family)